MAQQITQKQKDNISYLHKKGLNAAEISRELNIPYYRAYEHTYLANRNFNSKKDYESCMIKIRGYKSLYDYRKDLFEKRQTIYREIGFGDIVGKKLEALERNQSWLAEQVGISRQMASFIVNNKAFPSIETLTKIVSILLIKKDDLEARL